MPSESVKQNQSPSEDRKKHKQLDREIREMVSAITNRVTDFHKSGSTHNLDSNDDDEHGVRIITLAGTNDGATLKSELDGKAGERTSYSSDHDHAETEPLSTFVNSNFQAINNSMMLGGSFHANDPGVHLDISDFSEPLLPHQSQQYHNKKQGKKGKKKEKLEASKTEHRHSDHHDDSDSDSD